MNRNMRERKLSHPKNLNTKFKTINLLKENTEKNRQGLLRHDTKP